MTKSSTARLLNPGQKYILCSALIVLIFGSCIRSFIAPESISQNFLVVEGFINVGNDSTYITLSRSNSLSDSQIVKYESGASVIIEGTNNTSFPLTEGSPGKYSCAAFGAVSTAQYRLHVVTSSGSQYISDDVAPLVTPPIDSVTWANTPGGVTVYINTHGNNNTSQYYHWTYNETFEFQSTYASIYYYDSVTGFPEPRPDFEAHHTCWQTNYPSNILVGSTTSLTGNIVHQHPIIFLPDSSWKLKFEYSVIVQQQSIDSNTNTFFQLLHSNNDITGSIFDAQPTAIASNIHCINHPAETVIGYVYATSTSEQRIFINHFQVTGWVPEFNSCQQFILQLPADDALLKSGVIDITEFDPLKGYLATSAVCADCTLSGTNVKPPYWPN